MAMSHRRKLQGKHAGELVQRAHPTRIRRICFWYTLIAMEAWREMQTTAYPG